MASGTIQNPSNRLKAESLSTGTYTQKLNSLYTAISALSEFERRNSYIMVNGYKYYFVSSQRYASLPNYYQNKFSYSTIFISQSISHIETLNISSSGAISVEDASSATNNSVFKLYVNV